MTKIKKIAFLHHPVLSGIAVDFMDVFGKVADVVIIAGENGVGKSKLIEALYDIVSRQPRQGFANRYKVEALVETEDLIIDIDGEKSWQLWQVRDKTGKLLEYVKRHKVLEKMRGIFSEVGINYRSRRVVNSVTSLSLDSVGDSYKTGEDLASEIKQLLVDVQALDDQEESKRYRDARSSGRDLNMIKIDSRMERFKRAFSYMFTDLRYDRIENKNNHKVVLFKKHGVDVPLDELSSGEKQIVFRGAFLLRNVDATRGAIVFIDEPEVSLHPEWQRKILGYYRNIFTGADGKQTSQIFMVTHSPFIIHNNEEWINKKIIVLHRELSGHVAVVSRPEYYTVGPREAIRDAFSLENFDVSTPCVFVEGQTDEKYLNKALEVFGVNTSARFKWIGYMDENGQERNTGCSALDKGKDFVLAQEDKTKRFVFLYDNDTRKVDEDKGNVYVRVLPYYENERNIKKGIENALVFTDIDVSCYYRVKVSVGDYGERKEIAEFQKMRCCDDICLKGNDELRVVFRNLRPIIDDIVSIVDGTAKRPSAEMEKSITTQTEEQR